VTSPDWLLRAVCRAGYDPELWYASPYSGDGRAALAICLSCPVARECLYNAMETEPVYTGGRWGIAGAHTAEQRQALVNGSGHGTTRGPATCRCRPCQHHRLISDIYHQLLAEAAVPCPGS
jgi:hypothetical protein